MQFIVLIQCLVNIVPDNVGTVVPDINAVPGFDAAPDSYTLPGVNAACRVNAAPHALYVVLHV